MSYYSLISLMPKTPGIITSNLILNLDAGNTASYPGTGTTWTDLSTNGKNATLNNGVGYSSLNGGSLTFDGTNDQCTLPVCNFPSSGARTLNVWIKPNTLSTIRTIFSYGGTGALTSNPLHINVLSAGDVYWGFNNADFYVPGTQLSTTAWTNICCTYAGGNLNTTNVKIYINGVQKTLTTTGGNLNQIPNTTNMNYTISYDNNSRYYNGNTSIISFYNIELTQSEITQNFNAIKSRYGL